MKLKDEDFWNTQVEVNTDPYGSAILKFAENWANLMEEKLAQGHALEDIAEELSFIASANAGHITGFMYGAGVSILSACWEHGEQLRRWHNLDTQIEDEGERANETGDVLNPAVITINT